MPLAHCGSEMTSYYQGSESPHRIGWNRKNTTGAERVALKFRPRKLAKRDLRRVRENKRASAVWGAR